jgi:hypothetical protein
MTYETGPLNNNLLFSVQNVLNEVFLIKRIELYQVSFNETWGAFASVSHIKILARFLKRRLLYSIQKTSSCFCSSA